MAVHSKAVLALAKACAIKAKRADIRLALTPRYSVRWLLVLALAVNLGLWVGISWLIQRLV